MVSPPIIIESDSESVVNCIKGNLFLVEIDHIISDCNFMLSSRSNVSVAFIKRCKNSVAHALVGVARDLGSKSWVGTVPQAIAAIICKDSPLLI